VNHATVFPTLRYDDAQEAVGFLTEAFGFERHALYVREDDTVHHAELRYGNGLVMLASANADFRATRGVGGGVYVVVDDADAHARRRALPGPT
jgi:uncharacterized glyoxalase superfamily protein PhnB